MGMKFFNEIQNKLFELRSPENLQVFIQQLSCISTLVYLILVLEIPASHNILVDLAKTLP